MIMFGYPSLLLLLLFLSVGHKSIIVSSEKSTTKNSFKVPQDRDHI